MQTTDTTTDTREYKGKLSAVHLALRSIHEIYTHALSGKFCGLSGKWAKNTGSEYIISPAFASHQHRYDYLIIPRSSLSLGELELSADETIDFIRRFQLFPKD